jgi:hypothetical protein
VADQSLHKQALNGVQAAIQGLGLANVPSVQVYLRVLPSDLNTTLPAVIVSEAPLPETLEGTLANSDDVGFPCAVTILDAKNQDLTASDQELLWRQQIWQAFHNKRPSLVAGALSAPLKVCRWEPGNVIDLELYRSANLWASAMVIRVVARIPRAAST